MTKQFISKIRETFLSKILEVKQFSWIQFSYYSFIHKIKHIYTALLHLKAQRYTDKEQEVWTLNRQATWVPSFPLSFSFPAHDLSRSPCKQQEKACHLRKKCRLRKLCVIFVQGTTLISIPLELDICDWEGSF